MSDTVSSYTAPSFPIPYTGTSLLLRPFLLARPLLP